LLAQSTIQVRAGTAGRDAAGVSCEAAAWRAGPAVASARAHALSNGQSRAHRRVGAGRGG
jgi:hypothetical protein